MKRSDNIFQYCLNSHGFIHYMRAIQGHSGGNKVDPSLLNNVKIPFNWREYIYPVGSCLDLHFIIQSGLVAGGKEGRQAVFFTAVNPMTDSQEDGPYDVTKPRKVPYKTESLVFQDAVFLDQSQRALRRED